MKRLVFVFLSLFLISFVSADYDVGNLSYSIDDSYGPEDNINGWVNMSFSDEPGDGLFEDSMGNSIKLVDLLNLTRSTYDYDCLPSSCDSSYTGLSPATSKSFNLGTGEEKLFGFRVVGEIQGISNISFDVESDAGSSCFNQLEIDFLDDGSVEKGNTNPGSGECGFLRSDSCYDTNQGTSEFNIGQTPYCQRIILTESPGFKLGAWVKKSGANSTISIGLKNLFGEEVQGTSCELPDASSSGEEVFCEIDFLVTESEDYYVCVSSDEDTDYKIKGYNDVNGCGFFGEDIQTESAAYDIFVEGKRFGPVGNLTVTNELPNENTISAHIEDYISLNFDSDCSSGCVIPVRMKSGASQDVVLKNLNLRYQTSTGVPTEVNFYDLEESAALINSDYGRIFLDDAGFSVPEELGNYSFELSFNEDLIISEKVFVEEVPLIFGLDPTITVSALPTEFEVNVNSTMDISKYFWKFGDGLDEITSVNRVTHAYNSTGNYDLEIEVTDSSGKTSSRTFTISVQNPEEAIDALLTEKKEDLDFIKTKMEGFSEFYETELNLILDTIKLDNDLKDLQRRFEASFTESDFNQIMTELFEVKVPSDVDFSKKGERISFISSEGDIDLDILSNIEGGSYEFSQTGLFKEAVLSWHQENLEVKVSFDEVSATYGSGQERVGTFFELDISKTSSVSYNPYLVIKGLSNLKFDDNYFEVEESGYTYIELKRDSDKIGFFTSEEVSLEDLPVFISPGLDRLSIVDLSIDGGEPERRTALLVLVLILILILGLVVYIILQEWYRKKYEKYLFRDPTNLYNLINYIDSETKKGSSEKEIAKKLRKAGWNSEQTTYALRKHAGKRTGMWEIPVNKILSKLRRKGVNVPTGGQKNYSNPSKSGSSCSNYRKKNYFP